MLEQCMVKVLLGLPIAIPCGLACFAAAQWSFRLKSPAAQRVVRGGLWVCLAALAAGIVYGLLRFSGAVIFPEDNCFSCNWFNTSWRDEGFRYLYCCAVVLCGIGVAWRREKRRAGT